MKIITKAYGELEVSNDVIYSFPNGILGFNDLKKWALIEIADSPFYNLQSLEDETIAFFLINPLSFRKDYEPKAAESDLKSLKMVGLDQKHIEIFVIVNVPNGDAFAMTANLQGPLLFNTKDKIAGQSISSDNRWNVRHVIADEVAQVSSC